MNEDHQPNPGQEPEPPARPHEADLVDLLAAESAKNAALEQTLGPSFTSPKETDR